MTKAQRAAELIAKLRLGIPTLKEQKSDRLDFHQISVWSLEEALVLAFEMGEMAGQANKQRKKVKE